MIARTFLSIVVLPGTTLVGVPGILQWISSEWPFTSEYGSATALGVAATLAVPAMGLAIWTISLFGAVGEGTLAPWDPPTSFVAAGPYRYTRNPMISAVLVMIIAEGLALDSLPILVWALIFFALNTIYFILIEEPGLQRRFGQTYLNYKAAVPRWLPRRTPYMR